MNNLNLRIIRQTQTEKHSKNSVSRKTFEKTLAQEDIHMTHKISSTSFGIRAILKTIKRYFCAVTKIIKIKKIKHLSIN